MKRQALLITCHSPEQGLELWIRMQARVYAHPKEFGEVYHTLVLFEPDEDAKAMTLDKKE